MTESTIATPVKSEIQKLEDIKKITDQNLKLSHW